MVSFSLMEWNSRTPVESSWGTLSLNSAKATEISERLKLSGLEIRGEGGVHNNAVNTSGGDVFSGSDLAHFSLSPHSLSASNDLSSREETKTYSTVVLPKDFGEKNQLASVSDCGTLGASHGSDESLISLKLGECTYFEDFCTVSTTDASSLPTIPTSSTNTAKRSRAVYQSTQTLHCQVEGCNVDLKSAKDYYRKHRICVNHSKSPKVIVAGIVRRFCQQCSRFHDLSEFDDKKRSCRRRLSDHNARRRRPRPEAMHFNLSRLPSSIYDFTDGRQRMNLVSNRVPFPVANSTWQSSCSVKVALPQPSLIRPTKAGGIDRHLDTPTEEMSNSISTLHLDASRILPLEGGTPLMLNQGLEASTIVSNLDLPPDLRRALSLLSTNSWGLNESETTTIDHLMHLNQASVIHPVLHAESQNWDPSSEYLRAEQLPSESMHSLDLHNSSSNPFQEGQFLKAPYASGCFYSNQIS